MPHDQDDDLAEIIVVAQDGGGGGGGGGGYWGGFDNWGGWADSFIWSIIGSSNGPDESGGGDSSGDVAPEIVVTAQDLPQVVTAQDLPPMGNLDGALDVITQFLTWDSLDDFIGAYRLRVTPGDQGRIEVDIVETGSDTVQTFVLTQNGDLQFETPLDQVTAFPDQPWEYSGPDMTPLPQGENWHWA